MSEIETDLSEIETDQAEIDTALPRRPEIEILSYQLEKKFRQPNEGQILQVWSFFFGWIIKLR